MKFRSRAQELPCVRPTPASCEKGYVLFEALLAVIILSVGIVALIQVFQKSVQGVQFRQHYYGPARELAEAVLAKLEIDAIAGVQKEGTARYGESGAFSYTVVRSDWPAAPDLQKVSVTVRWTDRGKPGSITLTTLLPVVKSAGEEQEKNPAR